jgi:hypothetical protein
LGCQSSPTGYVNVTKKDGSSEKVGDFSTSGGGLSGNFTTAIPTTYGYDANAVGDSMHINLYVCGQPQGGWDITLKSSAGNAECDPRNNDHSNNDQDIQDCGGSIPRTCDASKHCAAISGSQNGTPSASAAAARSSFEAALASGGQAINVDVTASMEDKLAICNTGLMSNVFIEVFVDGQSVGRQAGTYSGKEHFAVSYSSKLTTQKTVTVKICSYSIGQPVTVNPPIR